MTAPDHMQPAEPDIPNLDDILEQFEALDARYRGSEAHSSEEEHDECGDIARAAEQWLLPAVGDRAWRVAYEASVGRRLVATRCLAANTVVFQEKPFIVAKAVNPGDAMMVAVATALLAEPSDGPRQLLQPPQLDAAGTSNLEAWAQRMFVQKLRDEGVDSTLEDFTWAIGVASVNVHSAQRPCRGECPLQPLPLTPQCVFPYIPTPMAVYRRDGVAFFDDGARLRAERARRHRAAGAGEYSHAAHRA